MRLAISQEFEVHVAINAGVGDTTTQSISPPNTSPTGRMLAIAARATSSMVAHSRRFLTNRLRAPSRGGYRDGRCTSGSVTSTVIDAEMLTGVRYCPVWQDPAMCDKVLDAAAVLVAAHGLAEVTFDDVAHAASMSRARLAKLYRDLPAVLDAWAARTVDRYLVELAAVLQTTSTNAAAAMRIVRT